MKESVLSQIGKDVGSGIARIVEEHARSIVQANGSAAGYLHTLSALLTQAYRAIGKNIPEPVSAELQKLYENNAH